MREQALQYPVQSSPAAYWGEGLYEGCPPIIDLPAASYDVRQLDSVSVDVPVESLNPDAHIALAATGLPAGLAITGSGFAPLAGRISGTVSAAAAIGNHPVTLTASDDHGMSTRTTVFRVSAPARTQIAGARMGRLNSPTSGPAFVLRSSAPPPGGVMGVLASPLTLPAWKLGAGP